MDFVAGKNRLFSNVPKVPGEIAVSLYRQTFCLAGIMIALLFISCNKREPLFERLPAEETSVRFSNDITQNDSINIIDYTNMFNGGGVAVADFNNDGLQDLYFTGNMVENELYLNQGEFRFRNVTEEANVAAKGRWSSGVAVVDINGDGLMDIYVCATTYDEPERRTNLFYINQGVNNDGIPVFSEMGSEYNVADAGHTTMAAFFDYDRDGDLDLFLMQNQFNRHGSMDRYHKKLLKGESETTDRLLRNDTPLSPPLRGDVRGVFTDVSDEAGILIEGFGLGLNITDINRDGWKDIYIANDFITNDVLYINNKDGTFTDKAGEIFKHTAHAAMGNDVADVNNDGYSDVIVVDMRPDDNFRKKKMLQPNTYSAYLNNERYNYDYQFVRNVLQVYQGTHPETGEPVYSDTGIWSGIAETDWSWTPLMVDFDNDGWRDIIITNGFPNDLTDHDFEEYFRLYPEFISLEDLIDRMPSVKISNYVYRNNGDLTFEDVTERWGMKIPSFSNGAAQADLNNDGALDFVVNNINEPAFIFRNRQAELNPERNDYLRVKLEGTGSNTMGLGALLEIEYGDGEKQFHEHTLYRGYLSSVEPVVHFGLGAHKMVDKLTVIWPDRTVQVIRDLPSNQVVTLHQKDAVDLTNAEPDSPARTETLFRDITGESGIDYMHKEWDYNDFNVQPLLPHKLSQYGPGLSVGDVNSDGLNDIYISGAFEYKGAFLIQRRDGTFAEEDLLVGNDPENREEEMASLFFDADGDGDDDLYIVSGSYEHQPGDRAYQDRLFINVGGRFLLAWNALPPFLSSGSAVRAADFDRDGDLDLFVGGRVKPHRYPEPVDSYILENVSEKGKVRFKIANDETAPVLNEIGMVSDALWTDFNNDGWTDLILAGEWMSLRFLKNDSGTFTDLTEETGIASYKGWWNSLCGGDFDNDGDTDYIAGNLGTNTYFQAGDEYPVSIYANDFDNNGVFDAILSVYYKNREGYKVEVPFHGRQNVSRQIPLVGKEFETYSAFASATMDDLFSRFETGGMLTYRANHMKTSYVENLGSGRFAITPLPDKVQWAPMYGCVAEDVNSDGNPDVMLTGNDYGMELSAGRSDALNGLLLTDNGNGSFEIMDFEKSGLFVPGDAKALISFVNAQNELVVAASQNRGPLKMFKKGGMNKPVPVQPGDAFSVIYLKDGRKQKKEFYYGSGFLSQSERYLIPPDEYVKIEITDFQGNTRSVTPE